HRRARGAGVPAGRPRPRRGHRRRVQPAQPDEHPRPQHGVGQLRPERASHRQLQHPAGRLQPAAGPGRLEGEVLNRPTSSTDPLEFGASEAIAAHQLGRLGTLLGEVVPRNRFWAGKLAPALTAGRSSVTWEAFARWPFTTKAELTADQETHPPLGAVATYPRERYVAYHQTSGTQGRPMVVLDTAESWEWWVDCWQQV